MNHDLSNEPTDEASDELSGAEATATNAPQSETERLEIELAEMRDRALRTQADLENVRKRHRRELEEQHRYAAAPLLRDLLPVIDNLGRALQAAESSGETSSLSEGVNLVAQQLEQVLKQHHCVRIEALHEPFDPNFHEAISQQPTSEYPPGTVVLVAQQGYLLHDRVLRPAQVIVAVAAG